MAQDTWQPETPIEADVPLTDSSARCYVQFSPRPGRSGEIGIRSRLKICRYLVPWGFKSPLRHLRKSFISRKFRQTQFPRTIFVPNRLYDRGYVDAVPPT